MAPAGVALEGQDAASVALPSRWLAQAGINANLSVLVSVKGDSMASIIIMVINIEIAAITPPVGMNLFVLKAVIPGAEMRDIVRGSALFIVPLVLGLVLLLIFPEIALWLPRVLA